MTITILILQDVKLIKLVNEELIVTMFNKGVALSVSFSRRCCICVYMRLYAIEKRSSTRIHWLNKDCKSS